MESDSPTRMVCESASINDSPVKLSPPKPTSDLDDTTIQQQLQQQQKQERKVVARTEFSWPRSLPGVQQISQRAWRTKIAVGRVQVHLGTFYTAEAASTRFQEAKRVKAEMQKEAGKRHSPLDVIEFRKRMGL